MSNIEENPQSAADNTSVQAPAGQTDTSGELESLKEEIKGIKSLFTDFVAKNTAPPAPAAPTPMEEIKGMLAELKQVLSVKPAPQAPAPAPTAAPVQPVSSPVVNTQAQAPKPFNTQSTSAADIKKLFADNAARAK